MSADIKDLQTADHSSSDMILEENNSKRRDRSRSEENGKLAKKLKSNSHSLVDNHDNLDNILAIDTHTIENTNNNALTTTQICQTSKYSSSQGFGRINSNGEIMFNSGVSLLNPPRQGNTVSIRTKDDIERSIKDAATLTHGTYLQASKETNENLMKFWQSGIYECKGCNDGPPTFFSLAKWMTHIKSIHKITRAEYNSKFGNPDVTQFKHSCYLCGTKMLQNYSVVKKHLETKHDSMTIEYYTSEFKELIVQERAKQPVLHSNKAILPGWSEGCVYSCNICGTNLCSSGHLENHVSFAHKNIDATTINMLSPVLTRYHKCYICGKRLRHEHKIIYRHLHTWHNLDVNKYAQQFYQYIRLELQVKGMIDILDYETELAQRPSLEAYLKSSKNVTMANVANNEDKEMQDWANFCDYKCHCQEIFGSYLKLHLHIVRKHGYKNMTQYKKEHGEPFVVHRLHKCRFCQSSIQWEASRIRDHLKNMHKDKDLTLHKYGLAFREEILSEIKNIKIESKTQNVIVEKSIVGKNKNVDTTDLEKDNVESTNTPANMNNQTVIEVEDCIIEKPIQNVVATDDNAENKIYFVAINRETGELSFTKKLPKHKEAESSNTENNLIYLCNSVSNKDNLVDHKNCEELEENCSSDEEVGSLTGKVVVVDSSETDQDSKDSENLTTDPRNSDKIDEHKKKTISSKDNDIVILENSTVNDKDIARKDESLSPVVDIDDDDSDDQTEYDLEQIIVLSADCKSYVLSTSRKYKQSAVDDKSTYFSEDLKVNDDAQESNKNTKEISISKEVDTNNIDKTNKKSNIKDKPIIIEKTAKKSTNKNLEIYTERNLIKNLEEEKNHQIHATNKPFQSILIGNDGKTQRIAVIYRKGESNQVDRTVLLNHISSLITNIGQESANLKIIEIEVDAVGDNVEKAADLLLKSTDSALTRRKKTNESRPNEKSKDGNSASNSQGFALKTISLPTELGNNRVSRGTQVSKWTKMGEDLQKVAAHKLVESRRSKMTGSARIYDHLYDEDISGKNDFVSESGVALCSVGVQVMWENRTRGTIDLDEENLARDRIATWIMENSQQIQTCRQCPGCFKEFSRGRNLLQHLQTKHGVQLSGTLGQTFQMYLESENTTVSCPQCGINISRKSLRRHERKIHNKDNTKQRNLQLQF